MFKEGSKEDMGQWLAFAYLDTPRYGLSKALDTGIECMGGFVLRLPWTVFSGIGVAGSHK